MFQSSIVAVEWNPVGRAISQLERGRRLRSYLYQGGHLAVVSRSRRRPHAQMPPETDRFAQSHNSYICICIHMNHGASDSQTLAKSTSVATIRNVTLEGIFFNNRFLRRYLYMKTRCRDDILNNMNTEGRVYLGMVYLNQNMYAKPTIV